MGDLYRKNELTSERTYRDFMKKGSFKRIALESFHIRKENAKQNNRQNKSV